MVNYKKIKNDSEYTKIYIDKPDLDLKKLYKFCIKNKHNGNCNYILARLYLNGLYMDKNKSSKYYKKSASLGNLYACIKIVNDYYAKIFSAEEMTKKNISKLVKYCKIGLDNHPKNIMFMEILANIYSLGNKHIINNNIFKKYYKPFKAKKLFKKIYKLCLKNKNIGIREAKNIIKIYYYGIGTRRNLKKALCIYKKIYKYIDVKFKGLFFENIRNLYPKLNL